MDSEKKVVGFTALFEILMILKRELSKEKNDEMKYSHFLCTLERANQEKLKMAIVQLKCVPCLNKFTTNFNMSQQQQQQQQSSSLSPTQLNNSLKSNSMVSHANMSRLLKQMSLIVSTELQQIAIDLYEKLDDDKPIKFIKLKEEFRCHSPMSAMMSSHSTPQFKPLMSPSSSSSSSSTSPHQSVTLSPITQQQQQQQQQPALIAKQQQQINNIMQMSSLTASFKKVDLTTAVTSSPATAVPPTTAVKPKPAIFNPKKDLEQFLAKDQKMSTMSTDMSAAFRSSNFIYSDTF
jgi:hypothetical protein